MEERQEARVASFKAPPLSSRPEDAARLLKKRRDAKLEKNRRVHDISDEEDMLGLLKSFNPSTIFQREDPIACGNEIVKLDRLLRYLQIHTADEVFTGTNGSGVAGLALTESLPKILPLLVEFLNVPGLRKISALAIDAFTSMARAQEYILMLALSTPFIPYANNLLAGDDPVVLRSLLTSFYNICLDDYRDALFHCPNLLSSVLAIPERFPELHLDVCFFISGLFARVPLPHPGILPIVWPFIAKSLHEIQLVDDPVSIKTMEILLWGLKEMARRDANYRAYLIKDVELLKRLRDLTKSQSIHYKLQDDLVVFFRHLSCDFSLQPTLVELQIPQMFFAVYGVPYPLTRHEAAFAIYHYALRPEWLAMFCLHEVKNTLMRQVRTENTSVRFEACMTIANVAMYLTGESLVDWLASGLIEALTEGLHTDDNIKTNLTMRRCKLQCVRALLRLLNDFPENREILGRMEEQNTDELIYRLSTDCPEDDVASGCAKIMMKQSNMEIEQGD